MWKKSLAMMVIGSLVTGSSFAIPLTMKQMLMENKTMKSSLASTKHNQNSQFKFEGIWSGMCDYNGENNEVKIRIEEDEDEFSIIDLINKDSIETYSFDVIKYESNSDKNWYDSFTNRLTRVNANILKFEGIGMFGNQPTTDKPEQEKGFTTGVFNSVLTVNNNQLMMNWTWNITRKDKNNSFSNKCILKRVS